MLKKKIKDLFIDKKISIIDALKKMDELKTRLLIVIEKNSFHSLLSIGDIQRGIINNHAFTESVDNVLRDQVQVASPDDDSEYIKQFILKNHSEFMPIVNDDNEILDVIFWEDVYSEEDKPKKVLNIPVIIMAGGKGTRMQPLTHIIPKPLIPIDKKTIVEHIIDRFKNVGCNHFFMSVNYKSKMIIDFFNEKKTDYQINFFQEPKPLGTAGSLSLLKGKINSTFFISNCDILINEDYTEIFKYHEDYNNELTLVGSFRHYSIPYGTLETGEDGQLTNIKEKPDLNFLVNSGMYILEPHLIDEIPENEFLHITGLIEKIKRRGGRVGVFPVSEKSWVDIGEWNQYLMNIKNFL